MNSVLVGGLLAAVGMTTLALAAGATDTPVGQAPPPSGLQACAETVAMARRVVDAADPSFRHWSAHVQAQLDHDAGRIDLAETRRRWSASRSTADADIAAFQAALAEFRPVETRCGTTSFPVTASSPVTADLDGVAGVLRCREDLARAATAVATAQDVVGDWSAHVAMMRDKVHIDPSQYGDMWRSMVAAAPTHLAEFTAIQESATVGNRCATL